MKTLILFFSFCLFDLMVSGQNKGYFFPDSILKNMPGSLFVENRANIYDVKFNNISNNAYKVDSVLTYSYPEGETESFVEVREEFEYNSFGECTEVMHYINNGYDELELNWVPYLKILAQYNAKGNITGTQSFMWDNSEGTYEQTADIYYYYDENLVTVDSFLWYINWGGEEGLAPFDKWIMSYSADGRLQETLLFDGEDAGWILTGREEYEYDEFGNDTAEIIYDYTEGETWEKDYKITRTYDANGNILSYTYFNWSESYGEWIMDDKIEYGYDSSERLIEEIEYDGDSDTGEERPLKKTVTGYNSNGNIDSMVVYSYDITEESWERDEKTINLYDNGDLVSSSVFLWDYSDEIWEENSMQAFTYNSLVSCDVLYYQDYVDNAIPLVYKSLVTDHRYYDWSGETNSFEEQYHESIYSSEFLSNKIVENSLNRFSLYPNPATDRITLYSPDNITVKCIQVFDLNGNKLIEKQIPPGTELRELNVGDLKSGVYLCKLFSENENVTKKIIIQR